jgi:hypothetical protein
LELKEHDGGFISAAKARDPRADSTGVEHGEVGRLHQLKEHAADWCDKHQWQIGVTEMALGAACSPQGGRTVLSRWAWTLSSTS